MRVISRLGGGVPGGGGEPADEVGALDIGWFARVEGLADRAAPVRFPGHSPGRTDSFRQSASKARRVTRRWQAPSGTMATPRVTTRGVVPVVHSSANGSTRTGTRNVWWQRLHALATPASAERAF